MNILARFSVIVIVWLCIPFGWFPGQASCEELSKEELLFLKSEQPIIFVSQTRYPPFEFIDNQGERTGMCLELGRWIATEFGFQAKFYDTHFHQAQEDVITGEADVLTSLFYSKKRDVHFEFTQMIFEVPASIFVSARRVDIKNVQDLEGMRIAIQKGDYAKEFLEGRDINFKHIPANDFSEAIDLLVGFKADAIIGDEQIVMYEIFKSKRADLVKMVGEPLYIGRNCMAVANENKILAGILSKGIRAAQSHGVMDKINKKWLGTHYSSAQPARPQYIFHVSVGSAVVIAMIVLIWLWNVRLRNAVRIKTEELTRREEALMQSERKLKAILEASPDPMVLYDVQGHPQYINPVFTKVFGWTLEELKDRRIPYVPPEEESLAREKIGQIYSSGQPLSFETRRITKDRQILDIILSAAVTKDEDEKPNGMVVNLTDITKQKALEAQFEQAQKIESLGTLAGGIAHDFNNLLSGIYGYLDLALKLTTQADVARYLTKAFQSSDRAKGLTQQLLTFSKGGAPVKKVDTLIPFIEETTQFALSGSSISCEFSIPNELWMCDYDSNQIAQVIDNIVINACHSMPDQGVLKVAAINLDLSGQQHPMLDGSRYVRISISDSGVGIPRQHLNRIFDPFFTTKQQGSGLGLATSYSIVKRHGGIIEVESEPEKGSVFHIYLPATGQTGEASVEKEDMNYQGYGRILIMDDEEDIRDMLSDMLELMGFSCTGARDGEHALDLFTRAVQDSDPFRAAILDLTVPGGMGGKETIARLRELDGQIPVFVASGYSDDSVIADPDRFGFTASLEKPFMVTDLIRVFKTYL
ncbi:MAG: PAS domain S-box protein [Desulfobacteraceae bacterium]|nr:MAG: PAS domain S-box protein [Desulfobacteraceae bacterium]